MEQIVAQNDSEKSTYAHVQKASNDRHVSLNRLVSVREAGL